MNTQSPRFSALAILLGLLCFGLAVYAWVAHQKIQVLETALAQTARPAPVSAAAKPAVHSGEDPALLRRLLQEKETAYQQLHAELERLKNPETAPAPSPVESIRTNLSAFASGRGDYMERLRAEDPERYQRIQESREQRRQEIEAQYQQQLDRLQERRQKASTAEEAAHLDGLLGAVAKLHEVGQGWENLRQLSGEERAQQMQQLAADSAAAYQSYSELKKKDRQLQLNQLASQLGYKDPAQFATAVQQIYDETDPSLRNLVGRGVFGRNRSSGNTSP